MQASSPSATCCKQSHAGASTSHPTVAEPDTATAKKKRNLRSFLHQKQKPRNAHHQPRHHKLSFLCHTWNNSKTRSRVNGLPSQSSSCIWRVMAEEQNLGHAVVTSRPHCWCDRNISTRSISQLHLLQLGALATTCCFPIQSGGAGSPWSCAAGDFVPLN